MPIAAGVGGANNIQLKEQLVIFTVYRSFADYVRIYHCSIESNRRYLCPFSNSNLQITELIETKKRWARGRRLFACREIERRNWTAIFNPRQDKL